MADATRADSVPFDAMKVMLAFQRPKRQTHGAGLCRRGAARHGAGLRPVTSMISRRSGWRAHRNESAPRLPPATSTERHLVPESARHLSGSRRCGEIAVSSSAPGGPWGVGWRRAGGVGGAQEGPLDARYKRYPLDEKISTPRLGAFCSVSSDAFFSENCLYESGDGLKVRAARRGCLPRVRCLERAQQVPGSFVSTCLTLSKRCKSANGTVCIS